MSFITESLSCVETPWKDELSSINKNLDDILSQIEKEIDKETENYKGELEVYPPTKLIFNTFKYFTPSELKVVICGQDTYINTGEAMGFAFSVPNETKTPPSLKNIFKEINRDLEIENINSDLTPWVKQGVMLLNSALTVRECVSNKHQKLWSPFTDEVIKYISENCNDVIFMLWGGHANNKKKLIDTNKHHVLEAFHPSPLARNKFQGCGHFSECNKILNKLDKELINWST